MANAPLTSPARRPRSLTAATATLAATTLAAMILAATGCRAGAASETGSRQRDSADVGKALAAGTPAVARTSDPDAPPPVLVELFTSQGCNSCPPADAVLAKLSATGAVGDQPVIPLAFHVDYWNEIGWADPFSSARWSDRQKAYAERISGRVYTPQIVVHGARDEIGSHGDAIAALIRDAARTAPPQARLRVGVTPGDGALTVTVAGSVPAPLPDDLEAWVAVFEDGAVTQVTRGENTGKTLPNDRIVRRLVELELPGDAGPDGALSVSRSLSIALDPAWRADRVGVVVFLQDAETMRIHGAAQVLPGS